LLSCSVNYYEAHPTH